MDLKIIESVEKNLEEKQMIEKLVENKKNLHDAFGSELGMKAEGIGISERGINEIADIHGAKQQLNNVFDEVISNIEQKNMQIKEYQQVKEKLGWPDERFKKCEYRGGTLYMKTDRCDLEGKISENGIPYERKRVTINGVNVEGVFPVFPSEFDMELAVEDYKTRAYAEKCNMKLKNAVEYDVNLRSKFTAEQLNDIQEGRTPTGYAWHHNEEPGKMQLVKREYHDKTVGGAAHTGGNCLWGPDSVEHDKKRGESF